jgi:hypothetical protein
VRADLLDLEHVSLDGLKIEASGSKHEAMSQGRMEAEVKRLEREIREFTAKAVRVDAEEDELYGKGKAHPGSHRDIIPRPSSSATVTKPTSRN